MDTVWVPRTKYTLSGRGSQGPSWGVAPMGGARRCAACVCGKDVPPCAGVWQSRYGPVQNVRPPIRKPTLAEAKAGCETRPIRQDGSILEVTFTSSSRAPRRRAGGSCAKTSQSVLGRRASQASDDQSMCACGSTAGEV